MDNDYKNKNSSADRSDAHSSQRASSEKKRPDGGTRQSGSGSKKRRKSGVSHSHAARPISGRRKGRGVNPHYIFIGAAALLLVLSVFFLVKWNLSGEKSGYDPDAVDTGFDAEAQDYIIPLDPEKLAGREDDGVTTILCLGNAPFADERGGKGLAEIIAKQSGATVYNGSFSGSYLSLKNAEYSESYPMDGLSLYMVTASICGGNFDLMEHAVSATGNDKGNQEALETLKNVDFSKVDMIAIMYDLSDYMDKRPVSDENNDINLITWNGALNASMKELQKAYPHIRLVVLSPTFGEYTDAEGNLVNADTTDHGNGTLVDYLLNEINVVMENSSSILDNYYGSFTEEQKATMLTDGYHLTKKGREAIASRFTREVLQINEEK